MNIGGVYTPPIFIARGMNPSTGGKRAHDEYWKGVHPSNINREEYRRVHMGYRGTQ